jgi:hypothetical protein
MFDRRCLLLFAIAACETPPETISFDHADGTGSGLGDCECSYHDGTDNDWSIQVSCTAGGTTLESVALFADPRNTMGEGAGSIQLIPQNNPAIYGGGAGATVSVIGDDNHADSKRVIRDLSSVSFRWADQVACNLAQPCEIDSYHLLPGSLTGGHGACEDYYATQRLILGTN